MPQLSEHDQETLLQIAMSSVKAHLAHEVAELSPIASRGLAEKRSVFVSIHHGKNLRGCMGTIDPAGSLYESVAEFAVAAASRDSRFKPVKASELPEIEFEISVLSAIEDVTDLHNIEVGRHGLIVTRGGTHGVLLPQVAVQHQWDREQFLGEACRKAGLPPTAWKQGAIVQRFTAEVFP